MSGSWYNMLAHLSYRCSSSGPPFKFRDGRPLTCSNFVEAMKKLYKLLASIPHNIWVRVLEVEQQPLLLSKELVMLLL